MTVADRLTEPDSVGQGTLAAGAPAPDPGSVGTPSVSSPSVTSASVTSASAISASATSVVRGQPVRLVPAATLSLLASAALIGGCAVGVVGAVVAVALVQLSLAVSWSLSADLPAGRGALVIVLLAAAAADAGALRWHEHGYESALAVLGLAIVAMFAHQLMRRAPRARVVQSLASTSVILLAVCAVTGLLLLRRNGDGGTVTAGLAAAAGAAIFLSYLTDVIAPVPRFDSMVDRGLLGLILGTAGSVATAVFMMRSVTELTPLHAGLLGCGLGAVVCLLSVGTSFAAADITDPAAIVAHTRRAVTLRPATAVLWVICLSVPAAYVLFSGLSR